MPKKIFDCFCRSLRRDIKTSYSSGDKYLSEREIAKKFGVSLQTAHRGVVKLVREGIIEARPRVGISVIENSETSFSTKNKKIIVLSNKKDGHFYDSFYSGIELAAQGHDVRTEFMLNPYEKTNTLGFGEFLTSLDADGLMLLSFTDSALPVYHAIREGVDIVSDIILDELPILPARQTDNLRYSYEAAKSLIRSGCTQFFVIGYYPKENKRFSGFKIACDEEGFDDITYIELSSITGISHASEALEHIKNDTGFFISDYSSMYVIDSLCSRKKIIPKNILVYDTDDEFYYSQYLPPVRAIAPSFKELGVSLCNVLLEKWKTGKYPEPLQKKI
ncbi:GntR family transcriptional regulator [Treponema parvum]|uniref:GntR family transcriptional regulator n=1 Tax=Treponema parvum TaxID=138851 RepID=UPI001AEC24F2|nr:GntR family transcriptional regulator [Treponema parvum]QTQ15917.1 LacI family DNA-binding transcriptional regulator [Treponema parvum]